MRVMDELTESHRRTPSFHHAGAQSPRVGGCVGAFFNMFDWNPSKRFASTKRITADRPNSEALYAGSETRSFTERASNTPSTLPQPLLIREGKDRIEILSTLKSTPTFRSSTPSPASVKADDTSKRVPGVVARLMGLESLPDGAYSSSKCESQYLQSTLACEQLDTPPVLLQDLLRQEFDHSRKSLKEKLPGFTKRAVLDSRPARGLISQTRKKSTGHFGEHAHPYGDFRGSRPARSSEKSRAFATQDDTNKALVKQPFLARLPAGTPPTLLPSKPQSSNSPLLSPSMLGGKNTVRLLEAAVKSLDPSVRPSPRSRYCLSRDSHTENGASFRSERRATTNSGHGRVGSRSNSSSRSLRSQLPSSRTYHCGHLEMGSSGSRSSRTRHETSKQDEASRKARFETALVTSVVKSPSLTQSRAPNSKKVEGSPRALLGSHEASVRGFKFDRGDLEYALEQAVENREVDSQSIGFEAAELPPAPPQSEDMDAKVESPKPYEGDQISGTNHGLPTVSKATSEKPVSSGGFRSIRFRNKSGKQEKEVGGQGNRVFPSDKHPVVKPISPPLTKDAKAAGAGFSYSMLFSSRRQGEKKEGADKGEALAMKRTDSALGRSMLRRPSSTPGLTPVATTRSVSQCNVKKATKSSKKVDAEGDVGIKVETAEGEDAFSEEALSLAQKEFDTCLKDGYFGQSRCRSIDDVFPELPMEENDLRGASPDLSKTVKAVEDQVLGFDLQGESALTDCRSIERMFDRGFSESYVTALSTSPDFSSFDNATLQTSPKSPEVFVTECGSVSGTFPNSPLVKYEKIFFSSRNHLNLQHMFEVVSGDCPNDMAGRQGSSCLQEPQERVLAPSDHEGAAADLDTCSNSAICDTGGTPDRLEIQNMSADPGWSKDVFATPPGLKKFEEKLAPGSLYQDSSCVDESGQPSPVSVLENPFLDEGPTTPAASLASSQETDGDVNESGETEPSPETHKLKGYKLAKKDAEVTKLDMVETEQIKQAILDISRIRNIDVTRIGLEPLTTAPVESPQQEQNYVREVLDAANLLRGGESPWCSAKSSMNRFLFDRLEFGTIKLDECTKTESKRCGALPYAWSQGSSSRSERKLLFDSISEVMTVKPWMKTASFHADLPMFPDLHAKSKFRSPISGESLVKEVYRIISQWRGIAGNVLDDLIDYDMSVPEGRWVDFSREVAGIGLDIERMLMKEMIEEFAGDLASKHTTRTWTSSG